ncbi:signal peptidase I [Acidicapsa dinghuensis]|uniref:Signal peptidase I n=1 Tax=Acidicapsa dinghuensis TaxID=2218256 RepID=A0ABW1EB31_9BACT|nr:signal peptidase I [Acidicapsa dinghuensis]
MNRAPAFPASAELAVPENHSAGTFAQGSRPEVLAVTLPQAASVRNTPSMGLGKAIAHDAIHGAPEAFTSLLRTLIVALFVLTFITQPMVIPSESMEHTLLVGDFLLMNREALAPPGIWKRILPYDGVQRGEIVTFHSPLNRKEYLVKRVIGMPGDHLRIDHGAVFVNDQLLDEPYATFEPIPENPYLDRFPTNVYSDPGVEPGWWKQMQQLSHNGELVIPAGKYFMLGDNRNHSRDSRYWGFVSRDEIVARPLVIYFSLTRPSRTDVQQASDDRLGQQGDAPGSWAGFARWKRIFRVVR